MGSTLVAIRRDFFSKSQPIFEVSMGTSYLGVVLSPLQHPSQIEAGMRMFVVGNIFRGAFGYEGAAANAAFGAEV